MSNAVDMTKYMNFHLSNKDKNGDQYMSKEYFDALHHSQNKVTKTSVNTYFGKKEVPTIENGYALGWMTGTYRGKSIVSKSLTLYAFKTFLKMYNYLNFRVKCPVKHSSVYRSFPAILIFCNEAIKHHHYINNVKSQRIFLITSCIAQSTEEMASNLRVVVFEPCLRVL